MKVSIAHTEKKKGMIFSTRYYGVTVHVEFSEEEKAIIEERGFANETVVVRDYSADVDAEAIESRGLGRKLLSAAVSGADSLNPSLTIQKLLNGPDTHYFESYLEAQEYENEFKTSLKNVKDGMMAHAEGPQDSTFEL